MKNKFFAFDFKVVQFKLRDKTNNINQINSNNQTKTRKYENESSLANNLGNPNEGCFLTLSKTKSKRPRMNTLRLGSSNAKKYNNCRKKNQRN